MIINSRMPPAEYLAVIGEVAVLTTRMEDHMTSILCAAIDGKPNATIGLLRDLGFRGLVERVELLAQRTIKWNGDDYVSELNAAITDHHARATQKVLPLLNRAAKIRNDFVHGEWWGGPQEGEVVLRITRSRGGRHKTTLNVITIEEMHSLLGEVREAERMLSFLHTYFLSDSSRDVFGEEPHEDLVTRLSPASLKQGHRRS